MKKLIIIITAIVLIIACKPQGEPVAEPPKQSFNLKKDFANFKTKMTELDTLFVWVNRSGCLEQFYEKLEITKKNNKIKVKAFISNNNKWKILFEKIIPENDTIWKFEEFLQKNEKRTKIKEKRYGALQLKYKKETIHFKTDKLNGRGRFIGEYDKIMLKLYPENKDYHYCGFVPPVIFKNIEMQEVDE